MTELEKRAVTALRSVKMPEWGWHARCALWMAGAMMLDPGRQLSSEQAGDLWYLVWRYRRQIMDCEVVMHACEIVNGAMSLAFQ